MEFEASSFEFHFSRKYGQILKRPFNMLFGFGVFLQFRLRADEAIEEVVIENVLNDYFDELRLEVFSIINPFNVRLEICDGTLYLCSVVWSDVLNFYLEHDQSIRKHVNRLLIWKNGAFVVLFEGIVLLKALGKLLEQVVYCFWISLNLKVGKKTVQRLPKLGFFGKNYVRTKMFQDLLSFSHVGSAHQVGLLINTDLRFFEQEICYWEGVIFDKLKEMKQTNSSYAVKVKDF